MAQDVLGPLVTNLTSLLTSLGTVGRCRRRRPGPPQGIDVFVQRLARHRSKE